jgi:hypothetical protein
MNNFSKEICWLRKQFDLPLNLKVTDLPGHNYNIAEEDDIELGKYFQMVKQPSPVTEFWTELAVIMNDKCTFRKMFKAKIKEREDDLFQLRKDTANIRKLAKNEFELILINDMEKLQELAIINEIKQYETWLSFINERKGLKKEGHKNFESRIAKAKAINILTILQMFGQEPVHHFIKCPYHEESTPSCMIYELQNTFWSYCCNKGGDNITLVQAFTGKGFIEALNILVPKFNEK